MQGMTAATPRLNPLALALGFGVAGVVEMLLVGTVMGSMWGMMGGTAGVHATSGGFGSNGWMMGGAGMMGNSFGLLTYGLFSGFVGGAIMGGVAAWIYNAVIARDPRPVTTAGV